MLRCLMVLNDKSKNNRLYMPIGIKFEERKAFPVYDINRFVSWKTSCATARVVQAKSLIVSTPHCFIHPSFICFMSLLRKEELPKYERASSDKFCV